MNALFSLFKKRPNILLLMVLLIGANIVAWLWAFTAFSNNTSLLALSLIAWCYGLRHAVDADHIAAVSSIAARRTNVGDIVKHGLTWGLGHTITLFVFAGAAILLGHAIPKRGVALGCNGTHGFISSSSC